MIFSKEVTNDNFYIVYLHIINGLLHLTEKEMQVLAEFLRMQEIDNRTKQFLSADERARLLFGVDTRNVVQKRLGISQFGLNNYIKSLKDKRIIFKINEVYNINPNIIPKKGSSNLTSIEFKLIEKNVE